MEESEKMTALKKAYAEIILNTAKEAAARIMVSERKAHQFQHDLSSTKDEALRLLLRLKQTMDSKIKEAESKSLYQQKRIEELEAQLQEAEDIVSNLRAELNEAHAKLEEIAEAQRHNAPDITAKGVDEEDTAHVNVVSEAALAPQEKYLNNAANGHGVVNNSFEQYGYTGVPDVPSIIVRSKEPELYRNGCTQRIRACERNLLNGHFSLSGEQDDRKDEKILREDKEGEMRHKTPDVVSEIGCHVEAKPVEIKEFKNVGKTSLKGPSFIRKKRKRGARYRRSNASALKSVPSLAMEALSGLSNPQTCLTSSHHNLESFETEEKGKVSLSPSTTPSNVLQMDAQDEHAADALDQEFAEVCSHGEDEDREVASSLVLIRQQNGCGDCLDGPSSVPQVDLKNVSSVLLDTKESETVDGFSSPPAKERVLKYTFQRKRKKESLSSDNRSSIHQENSLKRKMVKKQNGSVELAKSSTSVESSRDSRRMAQVARQLISLSEKKWWK